MKKFILVFLLCVSTAEAKPLNVGFEGLAGSFGQWLNHGLVSKLPGEKSMHGWLWPRPPAPAGREVYVFCHSFGCTAAIDYAAKLRASKVKVVMFLIDARRAWTGGGGQSVPKGVKAINFYQTRGLNGYPVGGAENILITPPPGHTQLPAHPAVLKRVLSEL